MRDRSVWYGLALAGVLAWSVFVRVWGVGDRPFWRDEACVAETVRDLDWAALAVQREIPSPPAWLLAAKFFGSIISPPEFGYRFLSVLCGIATIPLVYVALRTLRAPRSVALASLALCASSPMLVIWSRELKQYGVEAFVSALLAVLVFRLRRARTTRGRGTLAVCTFLICVIAPWFGYGVVFCGTALLLTIILAGPMRGGGGRVRAVSAVCLVALALSTFGVLEIVAGNQAGSEALQAYMSDWYVDWDSAAQWMKATTKGAMTAFMMVSPLTWFDDRTGYVLCGMGISVVGLIGVISWPKGSRLEFAGWVLLPWLLMFAAALAHRYPFGSPRLMVVCAVSSVPAIAAGCLRIARFSSSLIGAGRRVGIIAGCVLCLAPSILAANIPRTHQYWVFHDFPAILRELEPRRKTDEPVLVMANAVPCVRYYARGEDDGFVYIPLAAGTLPVDFEAYRALVVETIMGADRVCWIVCTNEPLDDVRDELGQIITRIGFDVELVREIHVSNFGDAQLFRLTRPYAR